MSDRFHLPRRDFLKATALATLGALVSRRGTAADGKPNVVWIVNDASRAQNYSCYGHRRVTSPNLDLLASRGVVFERAYTQEFWTAPSLSSYMTGCLFPEWVTPVVSLVGEGILLEAPKGEVLAPTAFSKNGYRTVVAGCNASYITKEARLVQAFDEALWPGFDDWKVLNSKNEPMQKASFKTVNDVVFPWLDAHGKEPFFLYIHGMETHQPYIAPGYPPFNQWLDPNYKGKYIRDCEPTFPKTRRVKVAQEDIDYLQALYDGAILYSDHHVARLFDHLEGLGVLENTIIIYTSDHGEMLLDDGMSWSHYRSHNGPDETHRIPLIMAGPGLPNGVRVPTPVQSIDILPTLVELCGLNVDGTMDGASLTNLTASSPDRRIPRLAATREGSPQVGSGVSRLFLVGEDCKLECSVTNATRPEKLWAMPDSAVKRTLLDDSVPAAAMNMVNHVHLRLLPSLRQARRTPVPKAFYVLLGNGAVCRQVVEKGACGVWTDQMGDLPEAMKRKWVRDCRDMTDTKLLCFPNDDAPVFAAEVHSLPRGKYAVEIELLAAENLFGHPASALRVQLAASPPVVVETRPPSGANPWQFVPVGTMELEDTFVFALQATGSMACARRLFFYPDAPGAREEAVAALLDTVTLEDAAERQDALEALGYL